jgi:hypothetical protein
MRFLFQIEGVVYRVASIHQLYHFILYCTLSGSMRQPEMLLNPGSRPGMRGMSQSVGHLDAGRTNYSSSGPQRDFATLPYYHEPPTFEEAVRQSEKKSKQALSTGDLSGNRVGPPYSRSRPISPDSDSSDAEPLSRRPMFKVRPLDPAAVHRYTSAPALESPMGSPVRHGGRGPPVLYPRPQKKGIMKHFKPAIQDAIESVLS